MIQTALSRRRLLALAGAGATSLSLPFARPAFAQAKPIKVGLLLPYSGTYAQLGEAITRAMELYVKQQGGTLAGRADHLRQARRRVRAAQGARADHQAGPGREGRRAGRHRAFRRRHGDEQDRPRGRHPDHHSQRGRQRSHPRAVRQEHLPHLVRQQPGRPRDRHAPCSTPASRKPSASRGNTPPARSRSAASSESFTKGGGQVIKDITVPFPNVEFQAALAEIASLKPDAVYSFFAGGGALKFIKDYAAANLKATHPAVGRRASSPTASRRRRARPATASRPCCITPTISTMPENKTFRAAFEDGLQDPGRRLCGAGLGHDAAARHRAQGGRRRRLQARRLLRRHGQGHVQEPARAVPAVRRRTIRSRTSICASSRAARTCW